jgi:hypothetical protein
MSDDKTLQEQCYGVCWGSEQRIEELEQGLVAANNHIKRLEDIIRKYEIERALEEDDDDTKDHRA